MNNKIYIEIDKQNHVIYRHNFPFHQEWGLNKTQEQLEKSGILVDDIPEPLQQEGKIPVLFIDPTTKTIYYEYENIPVQQDTLQSQKINLLEQQVEQQNKAIADLTMLIASTQAPTV